MHQHACMCSLQELSSSYVVQIAEREAALERRRQLQAHPVLATSAQPAKASSAGRVSGAAAQASQLGVVSSQQAADPRSTTPDIFASQAADAFLRSLEVLHLPSAFECTACEQMLHHSGSALLRRQMTPFSMLLCRISS